MSFEGTHYGEGHLHMSMPSPGSPPGMSSSKSSKTSSLHSFGSDDDSSILADAGHFEEIGLDEDTLTVDSAHSRDISQSKTSPSPYHASYPSELRSQQATRHVGPKSLSHPLPRQSSLQHRDIVASSKGRPKPPSLATQFRDTSTHNITSLGPQPLARRMPPRGLGLMARSASTAGYDRRKRSPSPIQSLTVVSPAEMHLTPQTRRKSWQASAARERRSTADLERECDDDEDDNIPDHLILDNVPISPRPPSDRSESRPASTNTSPDRAPKERVRSVGNGTPPVAVDSGSLRSPSWRSDISSSESAKSPGMPTSPLKGRAKSWTSALLQLNAEAKALTEKLEEHADEQDKHGINSVARPSTKPRVKSALAELPPLRRTNIMIDPLPISKEKEAVLSRTRPSWLPPKDPAEEKRHLKEYQKMMVQSVEADKRRQAARLSQEQSKDVLASNQSRVWEEDVLARWTDAIKERRTRELWWQGVAPKCRGSVWSKAIGNELGLSETGYLAALRRAKEVEMRASEGKATVEDERRAAWFKQIRTDVEEHTWPEMKVFQADAPLYQNLVDVLSAYAMYRSDIGYVPGCNTIAAILLLNLPSPTSTFIALANILNRALPLSFIAFDQGAKATAYNLLLQALQAKSARLHEHLTSSNFQAEDGKLDPEQYLADVFTALFTRHLGFEQCTRMWDVFVFEGDAVLVRAALALLVSKEGDLMGTKSAEEVRKVMLEKRQGDVDAPADQWMTAVREAGKV